MGKLQCKGFEERLLCKYTELELETGNFRLHDPVNSGVQCSDCRVQYCSSHMRDHVEMEGCIPSELKPGNN